MASDRQGAMPKRTRSDRVRGALAMGIGDVVFGGFNLILERGEHLPVNQSIGWFFSIVGLMVLVVAGIECRWFVERGHRRRCWEPPEPQTPDDRSAIRRLLGTLNVPADVWWPARFLQNSLFNVVGLGIFVIGWLFVDPAVAGAFLDALLVGFGLATASGAWLLVVLHRR